MLINWSFTFILLYMQTLCELRDETTLWHNWLIFRKYCHQFRYWLIIIYYNWSLLSINRYRSILYWPILLCRFNTIKHIFLLIRSNFILIDYMIYLRCFYIISLAFISIRWHIDIWLIINRFIILFITIFETNITILERMVDIVYLFMRIWYMIY